MRVYRGNRLGIPARSKIRKGLRQGKDSVPQQSKCSSINVFRPPKTLRDKLPLIKGSLPYYTGPYSVVGWKI